MSKNVLLILAVIVTLLTAWLVISLASGEGTLSVPASSPSTVDVEDSEGPSGVEMSVFIQTDSLSTTVDVR